MYFYPIMPRSFTIMTSRMLQYSLQPIKICDSNGKSVLRQHIIRGLVNIHIKKRDAPHHLDQILLPS